MLYRRGLEILAKVIRDYFDGERLKEITGDEGSWLQSLLSRVIEPAANDRSAKDSHE